MYLMLFNIFYKIMNKITFTWSKRSVRKRYLLPVNIFTDQICKCFWYLSNKSKLKLKGYCNAKDYYLLLFYKYIQIHEQNYFFLAFNFAVINFNFIPKKFWSRDTSYFKLLRFLYKKKQIYRDKYTVLICTLINLTN